MNTEIKLHNWYFYNKNNQTTPQYSYIINENYNKIRYIYFCPGNFWLDYGISLDLIKNSTHITDPNKIRILNLFRYLYA